MSIEVKVKKNGHNQGGEVDRALKKLKRIMADEGILKEVRDRSHFVKPSEKKRKKAAEARSRNAKERRMRNKGMM